MAGVLGIGADGRASTPYDSWLDLRCAGELDALARDHGDLLARTSGCPPMVNHAPKLCWWRVHEPGVFARTAKWVMPGGYAAARLAGLGAEDAFIDATYLHFTGLVDARAGTWSPELADALGVPLDRLPRIVEPATVIGGLSAEAAAACGLPAGHADRRRPGRHRRRDARAPAWSARASCSTWRAAPRSSRRRATASCPIPTAGR